MTDSEPRIVSQKLETIDLTHSPPVPSPPGKEGEGGMIFFKTSKRGPGSFQF